MKKYDINGMVSLLFILSKNIIDRKQGNKTLNFLAAKIQWSL